MVLCKFRSQKGMRWLQWENNVAEGCMRSMWFVRAGLHALSCIPQESHRDRFCIGTQSACWICHNYFLKLVSYSEFFSIPKVGIAVQNLSCSTLYSMHFCSLSRAGVTLASSKSGNSFQAVSLQSIFYDAIVTFFSLKFQLLPCDSGMDTVELGLKSDAIAQSATVQLNLISLRMLCVNGTQKRYIYSAISEDLYVLLCGCSV